MREEMNEEICGVRIASGGDLVSVGFERTLVRVDKYKSVGSTQTSRL